MLWMSVVRTLAWCFHILELSSTHTGGHIKAQSADRSQTAKIALHFTERPLTTVITLFSLERTRRFHSVMNDSWSVLPWKYDPIQMITTFLKTPVVFSRFSRGEAMIVPEVRPTFSTWSPPLPPPAFRFTRALPNGPKKQKEKRLWTQYSRLDIKHLLRWDLWPLPVHGVDWRCWRQFREALYVVRTCFTRTFPQLPIPPPPCQPCEKWCTSQKEREVIFDCPAPYPRKSPTGPLQSTPHPQAQMAGLVPVVAQGIMTGLTNWTVHQWQFSSIKSTFSLASSRCVPPLSCCFRFLMKISALTKFTTTGAGYGLLTTSNPVGRMFV